jgi:hypothetical protein
LHRHPRRHDHDSSRRGDGRAAPSEDDPSITTARLDTADCADPLLQARLTRAVRRFRLQAAHNVLDEALMALPPPVLVRGVVRPMLRELRCDGDDAAMRFGASLAEVRLLAQARGWDAVDGPAIVLACAPREERVLELIALGLALADRRCRIDYLGAGTPTSALRHAGREAGAAAVVLSAEAMDLRPREVMQLKLVARDAPIGTTGAAARELADAFGGLALPDDPLLAVQVVKGVAQRRSSRRSDGSPSDIG